jgi:hypothetical protein
MVPDLERDCGERGSSDPALEQLKQVLRMVVFDELRSARQDSEVDLEIAGTDRTADRWHHMPWHDTDSEETSSVTWQRKRLSKGLRSLGFVMVDTKMVFHDWFTRFLQLHERQKNGFVIVKAF